jgi:type IV fimbrial biogenesis protein FimT
MLQRGVSLVEVLIGMAIFALLMALGVPQYSIFLANARLRASAESIATGLNLARGEAVKRNTRVEFVLTAEEPVAAVVGSMAATTTGPNWVVREFLPTTAGYSFIEGKLGAEGSARDTSQVTISSSSTDTGYTGIVGFTSLGVSTLTKTVQFDISNPTGGNCAGAATPGPMRCLRINVTPGGQIRICDPKVTDTKDTRIC